MNDAPAAPAAEVPALDAFVADLEALKTGAVSDRINDLIDVLVTHAKKV